MAQGHLLLPRPITRSQAGQRRCQRDSRPDKQPDSSGQGNQNKGEGTPDIGDTEAGDYPSEEPELPHVTAGEAYTDLYHMADHLRLMGRAYRDSSPDALGVMGDGLRRPFTYSTIFQHFPSCRRSLEFIYADPLDVDGCPVIDFARRLWQGGGYGGSRRGDVEETFSLDDVRQFTEINLATETFDGDDAVRYEKMLNAVFGYVIDFNDNRITATAQKRKSGSCKTLRKPMFTLSIILKIYLWTMTIGQGFRSLSNTLANLSTAN